MIQAERLTQLREYYFSQKLEEVRSLQASGKDIINLGIGSPDLAPPTHVVQALNQALTHEGAHQYQPYKGQPRLRQAMRNFYSRHYKVELEDAEVLPLMGSKEGILHISMAFLNAGDQVLIPNPGYPTYKAVTELVGAEPLFYELTEENGWLPDFYQMEQQDLSRVKLMWVNYPHMPTGSPAPDGLFEAIVNFAREHNILVVNDNPYSFILNKHQKSLLEVEGSKEVAMELNSLSKTFNMSGWRIGMLSGSSEHLKTVLKVKSNMDSGMFYPLQAGATAALELPDDWFAEQNIIYRRRRDKVLQLAQALGCTTSGEQTGMFIWARVPAGETSESFVDTVLHGLDIFIAPGMIFGSQGEGYVRFSLCAAEELIEKAIKRAQS